jgi:hypothetical protein
VIQPDLIICSDPPFIVSQPSDAASIERSNLQLVTPMKQILPVILALVPLFAVIGACVTVP